MEDSYIGQQLCLWEEIEVPSIHTEGIHERFQLLIKKLTGLQISAETTPFEIRSAICQVETMMYSSVEKQEMLDVSTEYPLVHTFTDGAYIREISIPANNMVVGKIHKQEHLNFISKGHVTVITEMGGVEELYAPCTMISPPGVKRLLFTHEDTVWTVVHVTEEKDLDKIEDLVIAKSYTEIGWEQPSMALLKG